MFEYSLIRIEGQEVIISTIDKDRVLASNVTLKDLDKLIFGINKTNGTGLKLYHKNNNLYDFRRSNIILTNNKFIKKLSKISPYKGYIETNEDGTIYHSIGIHLDPYTGEYNIITFDKKDKYVSLYERSIGEAINIFNTNKDTTLEYIKMLK